MYYITVDPASILWVMPTQQNVEGFSKERFMPAINQMPVIRERLRDDVESTILIKLFHGAQLVFTGANSPASLASRPVRIVIADEISKYGVTSEGDALDLAVKRTTSFPDTKKIVQASTPEDIETCRTWRAYQQGSQERFEITCPSCEEYQFLEFERFDLDTHEMRCEHCGYSSPEKTWKKQIKHGQWVAKFPERMDNHRSFHINEFYSPWEPWDKIAERYFEAKIYMDQGDDSQMKVFWNASLGLPWESEKAETDATVLSSRREVYGAELPESVVMLCAGVDVQADRWEVMTIGIGLGFETWLVAYDVLYGDTSSIESYKTLDQYLQQKRYFSDGRPLPLQSVHIDSGGNTSTQAVYTYVIGKAGRGIFAIKGHSRPDQPFVGKPSKNDKGFYLFPLNVSKLKDRIFQMIAVPDPGGGYIHVPWEEDTGITDDVLKQITESEFRRVKYVNGRPTYEWVARRGIRNEGLDTLVYALSGVYRIGEHMIPYEAKKRELEKQRWEQLVKSGIVKNWENKGKPVEDNYSKIVARPKQKRRGVVSRGIRREDYI